MTAFSTTGCPLPRHRRAAPPAWPRSSPAKGRRGKPRGPVRLSAPSSRRGRRADLAATWLGHATVLLEIEGRWVLTDPVWSDRVSPSRDRRPATQPPRADAAGRPAAAGRRADLARPLRPPGHRHHRHPVSASRPRGRSPSSCRSASASTCSALGRARRPHRRARLGRVPPGRRPHLHLHRGAALLRPGSGQQHDALGELGDRGRSSAGCTSVATPATPRPSRTSASATDRSS